MCWSKEVSLGTYSIGMIGSGLLFIKGYPIEAIFYGWVIQMQLIEYLLWSYQPCIDPHKNKNEKVTIVGTFVNHLEPIILWLAILKYGKELPEFMKYYMIIFTIITIIYTKIAVEQTKCTTVTDESAPHLYWKWNNEIYNKTYYSIFLVTLILLSFYGIKGQNGSLNSIIAIVTYGLSYVIYGDKKVVGAMWCWFAALVPYLLLAIYD